LAHGHHLHRRVASRAINIYLPQTIVQLPGAHGQRGIREGIGVRCQAATGRGHRAKGRERYSIGAALHFKARAVGLRSRGPLHPHGQAISGRRGRESRQPHGQWSRRPWDSRRELPQKIDGAAGGISYGEAPKGGRGHDSADHVDSAAAAEANALPLVRTRTAANLRPVQGGSGPIVGVVGYDYIGASGTTSPTLRHLTGRTTRAPEYWGGPVKTDSALRCVGLEVALELMWRAVAERGVVAVEVEVGVEVVGHLQPGFFETGKRAAMRQ
jgi:hypothetical protein